MDPQSYSNTTHIYIYIVHNNDNNNKNSCTKNSMHPSPDEKWSAELFRPRTSRAFTVRLLMYFFTLARSPVLHASNSSRMISVDSSATALDGNSIDFLLLDDDDIFCVLRQKFSLVLHPLYYFTYVQHYLAIFWCHTQRFWLIFVHGFVLFSQ